MQRCFHMFFEVVEYCLSVGSQDSKVAVISDFSVFLIKKRSLIFTFAKGKIVEIMNLIEKKDFIHSRLDQVDESLINEFYEMLRKEEVLKAKLSNRAQQSEKDIKSGKIFSRAEIEERTDKVIR